MTTWEDGTPKSTGNAFNWREFTDPDLWREFRSDDVKEKSLQKRDQRARQRESGSATLYGLSRKSDEAIIEYKRQLKGN